MYDELLTLYKTKKQKKEKIMVFSFINNFMLKIYQEFNIDIFRFDINEYVDFYGYKDQNRVLASDLLPLIKNAADINKFYGLSKLIAIDLPLSQIYGDNNFSLQKVVSFYKYSNADILVLNIEHNVLELVNKLSKIKIPVITYARNNLKNDNKYYLQQVHNKLIEAESSGVVMFILENFSSTFIQNFKSSILIPVISTEKDNKTDGFYARFSSVFGLSDDGKNKYLNLYDLIKDGVNDCIVDNR